ncbi:MAG: hypothetical protein JNK87_00805 [Bryobacterales bacterium]|nr:hypothetical protein [Bryobacterales bacterium]
MMWLWQPFRFVVVLLPLWLFLVVEGLRRQRRGGAVLALLFAAAFACGLTASVRVVRDSLEDQCLSLPRYRFSHWRDLNESVRAVSAGGEGEVVFMGALDPVYFLATGRQAVRAFATEPYALFYAGSREPLGTAADFAWRLEPSPATHLVVHASPGFAEDPFLLRQIEAWREQTPVGWELVRETGATKVFRRVAPRAAR